MQSKLLTASEALSQGWETYKQFFGLVLGGYLIYGVVAFIGAVIPFVNFLFVLLVLPPLVGGFVRFMLGVARKESPQFSVLFEGFNEYGKWMGVTWAWIAILAICAVPFVLLVTIAEAIAGPISNALARDFWDIAEPLRLILGGIGLVAGIVILLILLSRYLFVMFIAAEHTISTRDAFRQSAVMTDGFRPKLLWLILQLGLFSFVGGLALGIGQLVTAPVAQLGFIAVYLELKSSSQEQPDPVPVEEVAQ